MMTTGRDDQSQHTVLNKVLTCENRFDILNRKKSSYLVMSVSVQQLAESISPFYINH